MTKYIGFSVVLLTFCLAFLPLSQAKTTVESKKAEIDAAKIYTDNCAICHGDNGDANTRAKDDLNPPPRNFTTVESALELTRKRMIHSVTYGRPGTAMMAHKDRLSKAEIAAVVDYIRARFMRTPDEITPQMAKKSEGKQIFVKNCAVCHGDKGNTAVWARSGLNPPPRNFTTEEAARILTRDRMIHSVTNGRPGTGMMPFKRKFNRHQIEAVVDYIRGTFMRRGPANPGGVAVGKADTAGELKMIPTEPKSNAHNPHAGLQPGSNPHAGMSFGSNPHTGMTPSTNPHQGPHSGMPGMSAGLQMLGRGLPAGRGQVVNADMSLPLPYGLKGDIQWGRQFYMNNCFTCHGVKGNGDGPRASFNVPRPRNFTSEESRRVLNRPRIYNSITHGRVGSVMPAWGKVLNEQQVANLAEFVFETFVAPDKFHHKAKTAASKKKKAL